MTVKETRLVHTCDFCGKPEDQLGCIVAGPGYDKANELGLPPVDICEHCVVIAHEIVVEHRKKQGEAA